MTGTDTLLTVRQLEQLLKVDRITIYRMLGGGRLPGFKVGGQWRFSRQAIEGWLQAQRADSEIDMSPNAGSDLVPSSEALPVPCIRAVQEILAQALGVGTVTTGLDGIPLTPVANCSHFCSLILGTSDGMQRCQESWHSWAAAPEKPQADVCHAGLRYARHGIEVHGVVVAAVHAGQYAERPPVDEAWSGRIGELASACGLDAAELRRALDHVPVLDLCAQQRLSRLLRKAALTFSEIGEERLNLVGRPRRIAELTQL